MAQTLSTNNFGCCKFIVNSDATKGTHTTLAGAMASASSGDTIFLMTSVTENVTITPGVNITAWDGGSANTPAITGKLTMTGAGTSIVSGIELITSSDFFLAVTGSAASIITLDKCYLNCLNNTGISYTTSNAASVLRLNNCYGNTGTTGIAYTVSTSAGSLVWSFCNFNNTGASVLTNSTSSGGFNVHACSVAVPFSTSSTGTISFTNSVIDSSAINTASFTTAGSGASNCNNSFFASGSASTISIGVGTGVTINNCNCNSSNTNPVTGAGTVNYTEITFSGTGSAINTSTKNGRAVSLGSLSFDGGTNVLSAIPVPVSSGGTGVATLTGVLIGNGASNVSASTITQYGTVIAGASNVVSSVAPSATSGVPYISQGSASNPVFGTAVVAGGGTGNTTQAAYSIVCGGTSTTAAFQAVSDVAVNQVLVSGGVSALPAFSATPTLTSVTFGTGTALSVYAEGTWTPTLTGGSVAGVTTYTVQQGYYTRIGNLIWVTGSIAGTAATGTGNAVIGALPFTVKNQTNGVYIGSILSDSSVGWVYPAGCTHLTVNFTLNSITATIFVSGPGATIGGNLQMANATFLFQFSGSYQI